MIEPKYEEMANISEPSRPTLAELFETLEPSPIVSYVVDGNLTVQYCNRAWDRFALENGAPELTGKATVGLDLRRVVADDLLPFYVRGFEHAEQQGTVWECAYECSSPELFRKFQMRIHPLRPAGWSLVTNTLVIERHRTEVMTGGLGSLDGYVNLHDQITMCCHCRNSRRANQPEHWDFVPALLDRNIKNISHSLCPICLDYFYPKPLDT